MGSKQGRAEDLPDEFDGLRAQGGINRILGETSREELEERFIDRQKASIEATKQALMRDHAVIEEEE